MRKEIAQFLLTGQEAIPRIRVEHVTREHNIWNVYEILEMFCEFSSSWKPKIYYSLPFVYLFLHMFVWKAKGFLMEMCSSDMALSFADWGSCKSRCALLIWPSDLWVEEVVGRDDAKEKIFNYFSIGELASLMLIPCNDVLQLERSFRQQVHYTHFQAATSFCGANISVT